MLKQAIENEELHEKLLNQINSNREYVNNFKKKTTCVIVSLYSWKNGPL